MRLKSVMHSLAGLALVAGTAAAQSKPTVAVLYFNNSVLGKDLATVTMMQGGTIDFSIMNTNLLVGLAKECGLVDLPFLFESAKQAFTVLDGPDVLFLDKVMGPRSPRVPTSVGGRMPATLAASGKAMLAFQPPAKIDSIIADGLKRFTDATITDGRKLKVELKRIRTRGYADRVCVAGNAMIVAGACMAVRCPATGPADPP